LAEGDAGILIGDQRAFRKTLKGNRSAAQRGNRTVDWSSWSLQCEAKHQRNNRSRNTQVSSQHHDPSSS
jgi:hypothetical protein